MSRRASFPRLPESVLHRKALRGARKPEPASISRLVSEIESDYQFKLGLLTIQSLVQSAVVSINSDSDSDSNATHLADNLMTVWRQMLPHGLKAFGHGRAAFEKTYAVDRDSGLALVAGLDYLPFEHTELVLDDAGSFAGIELRYKDQTHRLDVERSWWFALDPTVNEPHGKSRYLGAALEVWKERRKLAEQENIWFSKFAIGHGVARAPEKEDVSPAHEVSAGELDPNEEILDPMEAMRQRCAEIESGGVLVLSSKTAADGKYFYEYNESSGQKTGDPLENRRQTLDVAALRALGIPERAITHEGTTGSYSLAQTHLSVLYNTCEGILGQIVASFQKYVIDKAVALNWPADRRPKLTMTFQPLGDGRKELVVELVKQILTAPKLPPLIANGSVDLNKLLEVANIPIKSPVPARS